MDANHVLRVDALSHQFGQDIVFENLSFFLEPQSMLCILGPNGAGKTLLLRILLGLEKKQKGSIHYQAPKGRPLSFSYVPQIKSVDFSFPAVGIELVLSGALGRWPLHISPSDRRRALPLMEQFSCLHLVDKPLSTLSGGQMQRLFLARALLQRADIVMLDEPETGMDPDGLTHFHRMLETIRKESAVMMVTHDHNSARFHADAALLFHRKQISFGPPLESMNPSCIRALFGHSEHCHDSSSEEKHT